MKYTVLVERHAQKQIMKLDKKLIPIIKAAIADLANNPRPYGYKKLKGEEAYRIRVGDYRVITRLTMILFWLPWFRLDIEKMFTSKDDEASSAHINKHFTDRILSYN